jgi:hypothetical protein
VKKESSMRLRAWAVLLVSTLPVLWTCAPTEHSEPDCSDDESLCPLSWQTANAVECNCTCQLPHIPLPGTVHAKYVGPLPVCLPPTLNASTATSAQRQALTVMPQGAFNQQVFKYCSESVADWLSLTVKSQAARFEQLPAGLACQPYRCTCDTTGARLTDTSCDAPCPEESCDYKSCDPILRQGGILDFSGCACSRTKACGANAPDPSGPGLCRVPSGNLTFSTVKPAWHPPMSQRLAAIDMPLVGEEDRRSHEGLWRDEIE